MAQDQPHTAGKGRRDRRHRFQYRFWIDANKDEELLLGEELDELKSRRLFASTIRNALKLFLSLKKRNIDLLIKLFPWVEEAIEERIAERQARFESPANMEFTHILRQQSMILEQLAMRQAPALPAQTHQPHVPEIDLSASIFAEDAELIERGNLAANMGDLFADEDDDDLFDD